MVLSRVPLSRFLVLALALAIPLGAFAAQVAQPATRGSFIEWQPSITGYASLHLTVLTPSGEAIVQEFKTGSGNPLFRLQDLAVLEDGQYRYELRVVPTISDSTRRELAAARAAGDDAAAARILAAKGIATDVSQSGAFTVRGGTILPSDATEAPGTGGRQITTNARPTLKPVTDDQVIPDDLIVQGSLCVGLDCVNGESFGFDTIRLKENNLRIKAEDTSTTAGFPTTDWQLTFNDSASGGSNKFSVEDITGAKVPMTITGGASTNSIFVDSTGRVGFRTSAPVLDLHVATSNTPAIRLEQNNSGGFTAQTWDVAGNEANFFVRDVTSGSRLPFRIRPGAATSSIDISADSNVGIGTASPETKLHVFGSSTADVFVGLGEDPNGSTGTQSAFNMGYGGNSFGRAAGFFNVRPDSGAVAPNPSVRFATGNTVRMLIDNEGFIGIGTTANPDAPIHYTNGATQARLTTAGVWTDASSRAAKDSIISLDTEEALNALRELNPVKYHYKVLPEDPKVGFIAEDVPELVATPQRDGLSALDIVAVVTKVVQDQQKTIEQLNERIAELERAQKHQ